MWRQIIHSTLYCIYVCIYKKLTFQYWWLKHLPPKTPLMTSVERAIRFNIFGHFNHPYASTATIRIYAHQEIWMQLPSPSKHANGLDRESFCSLDREGSPNSLSSYSSGELILKVQIFTNYRHKYGFSLVIEKKQQKNKPKRYWAQVQRHKVADTLTSTFLYN